MNKKPVSIRNIADELKTSVTTVSFVLNGKAKEKHISKEMTKKVLDYAKLINYRPNQNAQSLRTGKSKILIFMVEDISNNFFSKIARIFEDIAYDLGYKVIFCSNENDDEKSNELINLFNFRQVDGFVIVPSPGIKDTIETLMKDNIPVVLLDRFFEGLECSSVVIDNEKSSFDATLHLIHNQFKNIGFITIDQDQTQMQGRLSGYLKAVNENGLKPITLEIPYDEVYKGKGKERIKKFFDKETSLDAVFFATNYLVQIGLEVFKENNPSLINNLGIVSFDDNDMYKIYSPTITSVSQPLVAISTALMEVLLPLLNKKDGMIEEPHKIMLKTELIIRESSLSKKM
jgi:LacI family transcriptional regulator